MSETVLKFLIDELTTVRIVCSRCKTATEVQIDDLPKMTQGLTCPVCQPENVLRHSSGQTDMFASLAKAINWLKSQKNLEVQFVIPAKSDKPAPA